MPSLRKTPAELSLGVAQPLLWEAFQDEKSKERVLSQPGSVILKQWAGAPLLDSPCPASWDSRAHLHRKVGSLGLSVQGCRTEGEKQLLWFGGRLASCHSELG